MTYNGRNVSVIEFYGEQGKNRCGYCHQSDSCFSHGMGVHWLTNQDYQELIDRGWRRSGKYLYKPKNDETCCPCYTIKCDTSQFTLSKSQKKIIKKFNKFLLDGIIDKDNRSSVSPCESDQLVSMDCGNPFRELDFPKTKFNLNATDIIKKSNVAKGVSVNVESHLKEAGATEAALNCEITNTERKSIDEISCSRESSTSGADPNKPLRKKSKLMRMERRAEKLVLANKLPDNLRKKAPKNIEKNLETLLNEVQVQSRHKLEVKVVSSVESNNCAEVYKLYRKYQMAVHNDSPSKLSKSSFERFLVNSPLKIKLIPVAGNQQKLCIEELSLYQTYQRVIHNDNEEDATAFEEFLITSPLELEQCPDSREIFFGSFHQQYWLDENLIAVGVIDILPSCVSSVYFFYDPEYSFLSLGTYGSLREIYLVQQLQKQVNTINSYYMGFYIHSCPKMRYKGKLNSSYLLCPETYTWHLLDDRIIHALNTSKYQRLNSDLLAQDVNKFKDDDDILILYKAEYLMTFQQYIQRHFMSTADRDMVLLYGQLVGNSLATKLVMLQ